MRLLVVGVLCSTGLLQAQEISTVTGVVTDASQAPMTGVTVLVVGTRTVAITDLDGKYTISVRGVTNPSLQFSFMGYTTLTVAVDNRALVNVTLVDESTALEEIVIVGYGTQKKVNLTGAVDQVSSDVFEGRPTANVSQMLMGAIPNLNVKLSDGKPGRSASFNVRGTTSIGQGGSALILIDGVEGDPSMLNPNDIENVSVLKDAASSSIYGARAPYGVVLITTKNPEKGHVSVTYSANLTLQQPTAVPDIVSDGYTWAEHFYKAYYNYNFSNPSGMNKTQQFSTAWLAEYKARKDSGNFGTVVSDGSWGTTKGRYVYFHEGTDYYDAMYKDIVPTQTHNISVSGSEGKFDFYLSGRYYNYSGLFDGESQTDAYNMMNMRLKVGYQITKWLKITNNFEINRDKYYNPITYSESSGVIWRNIADEGHPSSPMFNPDGTMTYSAVYSVGDLLYGQSGINTVRDLFKNTLGANAKFLDNRLRVNADFTYNNNNRFITKKQVRSPYSRSEGVIEYIAGTFSNLAETTRNTLYLATNAYVEFEDTFNDKHYVKGMVGYNYEQSTNKQLYAYNDDLLTEGVENINLAMGVENRSITSSWTKWRTVGSFFRVNYIYDNRYLLEVNGRYDGSSKFPSNQRWAFFPSVSGGWRLSEEPWFNVSPEAISNVKIRASYGSLGNGNVGAYAYMDSFSFSTGRILEGTLARYTSLPSEIPESLTWETSKTVDVGVDLGFLNDRLTFVGDYYNRKTLNMYTVGPTLPDVFGASSPKGNYADMTTVGYELSLQWKDQFTLGNKPFNYSIRASLSDYTSTIDKYNNATKNLGTNAAPNYYEGMTVGEIWGFVSNGLWQTQTEIDAAEAGAKAAGQSYYNPIMQTSKTYKLYPGDIRVEDLNGNGYIDRGANTADDSGDRVIIGNTTPRYLYSFNLSADWNNFFFSVFFQGVGKQDWFPSNEASTFWGQYNRPYNQMPTWHVGNYWTEDNPDAYLPRYAGYYGPLYKGTANASTRYLQNVAYIRLKNLQIGYNLPAHFAKKIAMQGASIYFSGENIWTWSPLYRHSRDIDVANIGTSDNDLSNSRGDAYNYPTMKSYSLGLSFTF